MKGSLTNVGLSFLCAGFYILTFLHLYYYALHAGVERNGGFMKLFVLILNQTEKLDDLMVSYAKEEICGATILDSTGMVRELSGLRFHEEEIPFWGSVRKFLNNEDHKKSKTIFTVIRDDQKDKIIRITEEVVGDFTKPDTGIMFIIPLDFARGKGLEK